jgi:hypothetical protein
MVISPEEVGQILSKPFAHLTANQPVAGECVHHHPAESVAVIHSMPTTSPIGSVVPHFQLSPGWGLAQQLNQHVFCFGTGIRKKSSHTKDNNA